MWPFKTKAKRSSAGPEEVGDSQIMRCATPLIWANRENPTFFIRSTYVQADGSTLIEDEYASEPGYSIKDLEVFYRASRTGAVKTGMDSVVSYEAWRDNQDAQILEEIRAYNEIDCRSTKELRDWLVKSVRPGHLAWWHAGLRACNDRNSWQRGRSQS